MRRVINNQGICQELQFPLIPKVLTVEETKEYHLKKLSELSLKSIGEVPKLDELTYEQEEWVERRMRGSARSWQRWFVGQYFTEEQKVQMGLTEIDIAGDGMA